METAYTDQATRVTRAGNDLQNQLERPHIKYRSEVKEGQI